MISLKVKICGITNMDDAQAAIDMGADILGFNFYPQSPRYIEPGKAAFIIRKLPTFVDIAGIFVNALAHDIRCLTNSGLLNWVQFHGDESPEFCRQFNNWNIQTIKAIRVRDNRDIQNAQSYPTYALLFDAFDPARYGGTGKTFDWTLVRNCPQRVFLAGGIAPDNVVKAIEAGVYGVDVCSGIESAPGKKDHKKMKQLFAAICNYTGQKVRQ
ncbi:MAG: phosphoribosylanthranilate isomerase [Planctomycetales bacterium]|nr:phosphoribosylanthranilate isomerase [Planctomycetales bacterium]